VEVDGERVPLSPDEVIITETPREGWSVASDAGATVALDLDITPELRRAGLARDVIRLIQEARKNSGLDVADRIDVRWVSPTAETAEALSEHAALICDEVLAVGFARGEAGGEFGEPFTDEALALTFRLRKQT
jgi:isoleucyl-tRNA synthetase